MELLERNGSSTICQASSFKYPIDLYSASAALVGTTILLCGGYFGGIRYDSCYSFDKQDNQWTLLSKMSTPRSASAAISIHNGVWITGGWDEDNRLSSTEFIFLDGTKKTGPSLPQPRSSHCLVQYKGTLIQTGGNGGKRSIDINRQAKEDITRIGKGPDMTTDRRRHGCGVFHSSQHGGRPILVIAGGEGSASTTSEYWDFTVPGSKWQLSSKSYVIQFFFSPSFFI